MSSDQAKALREAFVFAISKDDLELIDELKSRNAPFHIQVQGTRSVLASAMRAKSFAVVKKLLAIDVDLGDSAILEATDCPDTLLFELVGHGARFDEEAIYTAAETGAIDGAIAVAKSQLLVDPKSPQQIATTAASLADKRSEDAARVEAGTLGSYLTADQYRQQAASLRNFVTQILAGN